MKAKGQSESVTVEMGTLTPLEYEHLPASVKADVDDSTKNLLEQYGPEWLHRGRDRLRYEMRMFGVALEDDLRKGIPDGWVFFDPVDPTKRD